MWSRTLLAGVAGVVLAACAPKMTPQERAVEEQLVRDRTTGWVRALNNRAADSLATYYLQTADLTVVWPGGQRTYGWEEEATAQREFLRGLTGLNLGPQDVRVEVMGQTAALVTFRHSTDEIRGTDRDIFSGDGTLVWVKPDSRSPWVIRAQHLSRSPAPAAVSGR
jgi:ketosteroid isomerase-like protein